MKRFLPVFLILCLLLGGCAGKPEETQPSTQPETMAPTTEPTQPTTEPATQPTTEPATEPVVRYRNPLNGEPIDAPWTERPFASTLNNIPQAMPHHGVSQADIVYECLVEGGATRCLAFFTHLADVEKLGSVRSARLCFVDLVRAYDAIFSHAGANKYAYQLMYQIDLDSLDALTGAAVPYYYRDQARLDAGYDLEHTLFTSGPDVMAFARDLGYETTRPEGIDYGFQFADEATPDGETANKIVVSFRDGGKTTTMNYNEKTGLYEGYQHGEDYIDANTGEIVSFKNVFVLHSDTTMFEGLALMELTGSGEGYFACGGKIVPIIWSRADDDAPFVYTLTDGTPLVMGVGHSYIAIIPISSYIEYE